MDADVGLLSQRQRTLPVAAGEAGVSVSLHQSSDLSGNVEGPVGPAHTVW